MTRLHVLQHRQVFVPLYVQLDGVAPQIERLEPLPDLSAVCGLLQQPPGLRQPLVKRGQVCLVHFRAERLKSARRRKKMDNRMLNDGTCPA